jgi:hypothetical protein
MRWEKQHQHGRQLAVGLGAYRNTPANTLAQITRARTDEDGRVAGVSFFSYAVPAQPAVVKPGSDLPVVPVTGSDRLAFLAGGAGGLSPAFPRPAPVPVMPWIAMPERGWIAGVVTAPTPIEADGAVVKVIRRRFWPFGNTTRIVADGNGFFGVAKVKPGRYEVSLEQRDRSPIAFEVRVQPGKVARVNFTSR